MLSCFCSAGQLLVTASVIDLARLDHGIAGSVFLKQELVNISNCQQAMGKCLREVEACNRPQSTASHEDSRFDRTMDMQTGYFTRSMLVVATLDASAHSLNSQMKRGAQITRRKLY